MRITSLWIKCMRNILIHTCTINQVCFVLSCINGQRDHPIRWWPVGLHSIGREGLWSSSQSLQGEAYADELHHITFQLSRFWNSCTICIKASVLNCFWNISILSPLMHPLPHIPVVIVVKLGKQVPPSHYCRVHLCCMSRNNKLD